MDWGAINCASLWYEAQNQRGCFVVSRVAYSWVNSKFWWYNPSIPFEISKSKAGYWYQRRVIKIFFIFKKLTTKGY